MNQIKPYFLNKKAKSEKQSELSLITCKDLDSQNNQSPMTYSIDVGIVNEETPANNSGNTVLISNFERVTSASSPPPRASNTTFQILVKT